jgi:hypothetical protein
MNINLRMEVKLNCQNLEANGDIQAHAGTFRGMQWHVRNTVVFRKILGDIGEYRITKKI